MKTLQEQYNLIKEGKGHKGVFLTEAKKQFPNILTNPMGYDEASKMLKNRGVISENYVDLKPINTMEATPKTSYELKFADFLAEAKKEAKEENIKVDVKKTDKSVDEVNSHGFDASDKKNLDNQIGQEVLNGIYFEAKQNPDKDLEEIRKMVSKNLEKDGQYYMKNAAFGVEGLGYEEAEVEEVSGKHKSSGYSDKLKKMVKESLMGSTMLKEEPKIDEDIYDKDILSRPISNPAVGDFKMSPEMAKDQNDDRSYSAIISKYRKQISDPSISDEELEYILSGSGNPRMGGTPDAIKRVIQDRNQKSISEGESNFKEEEKPTKSKKVKKETLESRLAEIDKQGAVVALEAKIEMVGEAIEKKNNRINMVSEDENLSELVDKTKIKAMQKEVKLLEKQKAKMEKMYEKMCGKTYTKEEIIDETYSEDE